MKYLLLFLLCTVSYAKENRIKIAIIDSGIAYNTTTAPFLCKEGHYDGTGYGLEDAIGHGTNVAGVIAKHINSKTHCFIILKFFHVKYKDVGFGELIQRAIKADAKYINISAYEKTIDVRTRDAIYLALSKGIYVSVAAGNDGINLGGICYIYPACYAFNSRYFKVVASYRGIFKSSYSNYGGPVNTEEYGDDQEGFSYTMSGTSQATANVTGKLASGKKLTCVGNVCFK